MSSTRLRNIIRHQTTLVLCRWVTFISNSTRICKITEVTLSRLKLFLSWYEIVSKVQFFSASLEFNLLQKQLKWTNAQIKYYYVRVLFLTLCWLIVDDWANIRFHFHIESIDIEMFILCCFDRLQGVSSGQQNQTKLETLRSNQLLSPTQLKIFSNFPTHTLSSVLIIGNNNSKAKLSLSMIHGNWQTW